MSIREHLAPSLRGYSTGSLPRDLVAGLVLSALLVPQGMAYAELAGLPAVTGLYTSILCLLGYALVGPSRILVLGPDSSLGPMIAATILPLAGAGGDPTRAVLLASALAVITGVIMVIAGVGGLGFVADLLSKPTILGYMNGLALTIVVGQLPKLFGFSTDASGFLREVLSFGQGVAQGDTVVAAFAVGILSLALIVVLARIMPRIPAVLVAVVVAISLSIALDLAERGVDVVGVLPEGLPSFVVPVVGLNDLALLLVGALGIALVALADTVSVATSFAARQGQDVDGNGEMVGIGVANVAAGLFQGFPVSTSSSRTAVAERAGSRSQVTGVVGAIAIAVMLVLLPGLLADLPQATLAAIVIAAAFSLADIGASRRLLRQRRTDFMVATVAFLGVVLLGVLPGILVAIVISVANVFRRIWWPYRARLGRVPGVPGFHDTTLHPEASAVDHCVLYRFDAPLVFANARTFRDEVRHLAAASAPGDWLIIAGEPMTDVDTTACDMLDDLAVELDGRGIRLVFAELKEPVRRKLAQYGMQSALPADRFYPTIEAAVAAVTAATADGQDPPR